MTPHRSLMKWSKRVGMAVLAAIPIGMLLVAILIAATPLQKPVQVIGGSMGDDVPIGTVVVPRDVAPGSLEPGDLIVFRTQPGCDLKYEVVAHTFRGYNADGTLRTQGAAMDNQDGCKINDGDVVGKVVWQTPDFMASTLLIVTALLKSPVGWGVIGCLIAATVLLWLLVRVVKRVPRDSISNPAQSPR